MTAPATDDDIAKIKEWQAQGLRATDHPLAASIDRDVTHWLRDAINHDRRYQADRMMDAAAELDALRLSCKDVPALIARIDLEVAGRKVDAETIGLLKERRDQLVRQVSADAERIKGLREVVANYVVIYVPVMRRFGCQVCNGHGSPERQDVQHAPSCLLWKGPTK